MISRSLRISDWSIAVKLEFAETWTKNSVILRSKELIIDSDCFRFSKSSSVPGLFRKVRESETSSLTTSANLKIASLAAEIATAGSSVLAR